MVSECGFLGLELGRRRERVGAPSLRSPRRPARGAPPAGAAGARRAARRALRRVSGGSSAQLRRSFLRLDRFLSPACDGRRGRCRRADLLWIDPDGFLAARQAWPPGFSRRARLRPTSSSDRRRLVLGGLAARGQIGGALLFPFSRSALDERRRLARLGGGLGARPAPGSPQRLPQDFCLAADLGWPRRQPQPLLGRALTRGLRPASLPRASRRAPVLAWALRSELILPAGAALGLAASSRRRSSSSCASALAVSSAGAETSSRLTKVRFLRTSTWIVRALPLESACLISLVDLRVSVIFLRSALWTVPCAVRR